MSIIRVASGSRTAAVAGAIAGLFREQGFVEVQAIGPAAVNQAIKATVLAKGYLAEEGKDILFVPSMLEVEVGDVVRTAVRLTVESKGGKL
ncbi:MAG: stage V sporulation protein S [Ardenticatenaceae bacterium]|nr:stage V sporulation protein S [Ardenticatenaceae bacterium]